MPQAVQICKPTIDQRNIPSFKWHSSVAIVLVTRVGYTSLEFVEYYDCFRKVLWVYQMC
jgi:hypothetical protein